MIILAEIPGAGWILNSINFFAIKKLSLYFSKFRNTICNEKENRVCFVLIFHFRSTSFKINGPINIDFYSKVIIYALLFSIVQL